MPYLENVIGHYLKLTEHSQITRTVVYGITAFVVILGIDLISHFVAGKGFPIEDLAGDIVEATLLGIIAAHLSQRREERVLRRNRQVQYLNHHVRNALALMKMIEQQLEADQARAVHRASDRICVVIEQVSRDEDVCIDEKSPGSLSEAA